MPITVKIFNRSTARPTLYATRDFERPPVTIGRDASCAMVLEDPHKHISRFHVEIEEQDGTYWMSVVSKVNPVMVKGRRYGPGTRLTLHTGDTFEIGEYEVQVVLPGSADAAKSGATPASIFEEPTFVAAKAAAAAAAAPTPQAAPAAIPAAPQASQPGLARVLMESAGLPYKDLTPAEAERMMRECGAILRAAVEGIMMLLIARAEMRKEFQAEDRTMVAARDNNPLKLMSDPHEAMDFLFDPAERTDGFLDPVQAIGDACEDLRSHELALMAGMRAAILGALRRMDPHALERAFEKSSTGFSLASRKSRLWELFVAHQEKLARDAQEDFNKVFGRDFMAAYQSQLRRLKGGR
jgi:predicted component of type VI protein secretion system